MVLQEGPLLTIRRLVTLLGGTAAPILLLCNTPGWFCQTTDLKIDFVATIGKVVLGELLLLSCGPVLPCRFSFEYPGKGSDDKEQCYTIVKRGYLLQYACAGV